MLYMISGKHCWDAEVIMLKYWEKKYENILKFWKEKNYERLSWNLLRFVCIFVIALGLSLWLSLALALVLALALSLALALVLVSASALAYEVANLR